MTRHIALAVILACAAVAVADIALVLRTPAGDVTAPELTSATVASNGTTWTLVFTESVTGNTGFSADGTTTGAITLAYSSGSGTTTHVYSGTAATSGETITLDYSSGNIQDTASNALADITDAAVTNNTAGVASGSLRPELFGSLPTEVVNADFGPNDLETSVRTDVAETSRAADIAVPSGSQSSPYTASTANRRYYLQGDTTFDTGGIIIGAANITIDLNGYTLTFAQVGPVGVENGTVTSSGGGGGSSYPTLVPSGLTLSADSHAYYVVEFTSGAENGNFYEVRTNDGTTLTMENHSNSTDNNAVIQSWQSGGPAASDTFRCYDPRDTFGVGTGPGVYIDNVEIVNGTIQQGAGYGRGVNFDYCGGMAPVYRRNGNGAWMVGGVKVIYDSVNTGGIRIVGAGGTIKYCEIDDQGSVITNRQRNCAAVTGGATSTVQYNRFTNHRHVGVDINGDDTVVEYNEMHGDSRATNAAGINNYAGEGCTFRYNNIYKVGEHPIGIALHSDGCQDNEVLENWCESQSTRSSAEYGWNYSVGISNRWGVRTIENYIHDNAFITYSEDGAGANEESRGRTVFLYQDNANSERFENNAIAAYNRDDETECHCIGASGDAYYGEVVFRNNTIIGSHNIFWLSDIYSPSLIGARYIDNDIVKVGSDTAFKTFFVTSSNTTLVDFISNTYGTGTGVADSDFSGTWDSGTVVRFGFNLVVTVTSGGSPVEGATVTVKDKDTNVLRDNFVTDVNGQVTIDVPTYYRSTNGTTTTTLNPLTVEAVNGMESGSNTISPTSDDTITVTIE